MPCDVGQSNRTKHCVGQNAGGIPRWEKLQGLNALRQPRAKQHWAWHMWLLLLADSGELLRSWVSCQEWAILSFLWRRQEVTEMGRESPQRIAFLRWVWFQWQEHNFQRKIRLKHPAYITFIQQTRVSLLVFGDILFLAGRFWISIQNEHPWRHLGSFTIVQLRDCIRRKGALVFIKMSRKLQLSGSQAARRAVGMSHRGLFLFWGCKRSPLLTLGMPGFSGHSLQFYINVHISEGLPVTRKTPRSGAFLQVNS